MRHRRGSACLRVQQPVRAVARGLVVGSCVDQHPGGRERQSALHVVQHGRKSDEASTTFGVASARSEARPVVVSSGESGTAAAPSFAHAQ